MLRRLDDFFIDRVFQPVVNRLGIADPPQVALLLIVCCIGTHLARAMMLYQSGRLAENAVGLAVDLIGTTTFYGLMISTQRDALGASVFREVRPYRMVRLCGVLLLVLYSVLLGIGPANLVLAAAWAGWLFWVMALYFEVCEPPPPQVLRQEVPT